MEDDLNNLTTIPEVPSTSDPCGHDAAVEMPNYLITYVNIQYTYNH